MSAHTSVHSVASYLLDGHTVRCKPRQLLFAVIEDLSLCLTLRIFSVLEVLADSLCQNLLFHSSVTQSLTFVSVCSSVFTCWNGAYPLACHIENCLMLVHSPELLLIIVIISMQIQYAVLDLVLVLCD